MEPELQKKLDLINQNLEGINKKTGNSIWKSFLYGVMSGIGSIVGVAIALAIIGWILNAIGVIPAFRGEVGRINRVLDEFEKNR